MKDRDAAWQRWLNRRNSIDTFSTLTPSSKGRLRRKLVNFIRRLAVFCLGVAYYRFRNAERPSLETIRSVLIYPNDPIGDMILTSPMWAILRKCRPDLRLGVVISPRNVDVLDEEHLDAKYDLYSSGIFRRWHEIRRARRDGWDVVLATAGFYKPTRIAWISRMIAGSGITTTLNSARVARYSRLYSLCFKRPGPDECVPMVDQYCELIEYTFGIAIPHSERIPHFGIRAGVREEIRLRIASLLQSSDTSRYILVNLEAKVERREWGIDNVVSLADRLRHSHPDVLLVLTSSPEFRRFYDIDRRLLPSNVRFLATEDIHEVACVVKSAAFVISPDTAIAHLAVALGRQVIGFYLHPNEWEPYDHRSVILYPVRWEPISSISVDTVYSHVIALLS